MATKTIEELADLEVTEVTGEETEVGIEVDGMEISQTTGEAFKATGNRIRVFSNNFLVKTKVRDITNQCVKIS